MPDSAPIPTGRMIDGWRLERLIARGAMGALYGAVDPQHDRCCAIKVVVPPPDLSPADRDALLARVDAEAAALARLSHPGIVQIYAAGRLPEGAWLRMELLPGCTLQRYTLPGRLLPEPALLELGARIAQALAHAHGHGVVHRDLKPENVLVDWSSSRRVVLTDFGVARLDDASRTRTGLVVGSPAYMAPELLTGQPPDARSDLYALGVLMFQLLTGRLPYEAAGLGDLLRQIARGELPDLQALRPGLEPALAQAVEGLLARRPADRPADAGAVASAWQALAASQLVPDADGAKSRRSGAPGSSPA